MKKYLSITCFIFCGLIAMEESELTGGTSLSVVQPLQEQKLRLLQELAKSNDEKKLLQEAINYANQVIQKVEKKEDRDLYYHHNIDPKINELNQINEAIAFNEKRQKMIEDQIKQLKFQSGLH